jgi:hypothetical protein
MNETKFTKEEADLIKICTDQAKYFLSDAGEFFPFGLGLDQRKEFHPIGVYLENERSNSSEILDVLVQNINAAIGNKKYQLAGICTDVTVNRVIDNTTKKCNAIEIKIIKDSFEIFILYVPYEIQNELVTCSDLFTIE